MKEGRPNYLDTVYSSHNKISWRGATATRFPLLFWQAVAGNSLCKRLLTNSKQMPAFFRAKQLLGLYTITLWCVVVLTTTSCSWIKALWNRVQPFTFLLFKSGGDRLRCWFFGVSCCPSSASLPGLPGAHNKKITNSICHPLLKI